MTTSREAVEHRVAADHIALRGLLARVESVASHIARGEGRLLGVLLTEARALHDALRTHNTWEDAQLMPFLRASGPLGERRARYLKEDHGTQVAILHRAIQGLETQDRSAAALAREMIELAAQLRDDLADEEDMVLDDKLMGSGTDANESPR